MKNYMQYILACCMLWLYAAPINAQTITWNLVKEGSDNNYRASFDNKSKLVITVEEKTGYLYQRSDNKYRVKLTTTITTNYGSDKITYQYDTVPVFYQLDDNNATKKVYKVVLSNKAGDLITEFFQSYRKGATRQIELKHADLKIDDKDNVLEKGEDIKISSYEEADTSILHLRRFKKHYNSQLAYNSRHWHVGLQVGIVPSFALRQLVVSKAQFTEHEIREQRLRNETHTFGYVFNTGVIFGSYGSMCNIQFLYAQQGFKSSNAHGVDWQSGLFNPGSTVNTYTLQAAGVSVGYSFRPYYGTVRPYVDGDVYYLGVLSTSLDNFKDYNKNIGGFKIGTGISVKPNYWCELRIGPALHYNITFVNKATDINTRFLNMGLECKLLLHMPVGKLYGASAHNTIKIPDRLLAAGEQPKGGKGGDDDGGAPAPATDKHDAKEAEPEKTTPAPVPPKGTANPAKQETDKSANTPAAPVTIALDEKLKQVANEFSGMAAYKGHFLLLCEGSKGNKPKVFSIDPADIEKVKSKQLEELSGKEISIKNFSSKDIPAYQGLESIVVNEKDNRVYITVETTGEDNNDYIIIGTLNDKEITMDKGKITIPKIKDDKGVIIDNAGFESMGLLDDGRLLLIFECNAMAKPKACVYDYKTKKLQSVPIDVSGYRITDICPMGNNTFIGINFLFNTDAVAYTGKPRPYLDLVKVTYTEAGVKLQPLNLGADVLGKPENYEGIVANGTNKYLMITDANSDNKQPVILQQVTIGNK